MSFLGVEGLNEENEANLFNNLAIIQADKKEIVTLISDNCDK